MEGIKIIVIQRLTPGLTRLNLGASPHTCADERIQLRISK